MAVMVRCVFVSIRYKSYSNTPWSFTLAGVALTRGQGWRDQVWG
jgi:hypothetical protein